MDKIRTIKQNSALHLWLTQLAKTLNEHGLDMKRTLRPDIDIWWTPYTAKEFLFKPVLKVMFGKKSTKDMTTQEINEVLEVINKHLGEKFGEFGYEYLPFPSVEALIEQLEKNV